MTDSITVRRMSRRGLLRTGALSVAGLAGAALIGCDSRGGAPLPTSTAATGTPAPAPTVAPGTLRRGGTLRIAGQVIGDPPSLDFDRTGDPAIGAVANLAGIKLVRWDERPDSTGPVENVLPDLAERWESPDQGLTHTFFLRRGVKTSDGLEVKAADVVWSLERQARVRTPAGVLQEQLPDLYTGAVPNARALDDYTVQVKLAAPDADFLSLMGSHWWTVQHRDVVTRKGATPGTTGPSGAPGFGEVGSLDQIRGGGAYFPAEYQPTAGIRLRRNSNYHDANAAYLDGIDHTIVIDPQEGVAALQAGQIDAFGPLTQLSVMQGLELQKSDRLQVDWQPAMAWSPWIFDTTVAPFNDVRVRRAVSLAVDRAGWIKNRLLGRGRNGVMVLPWLTAWALDPAKMGDDGRYVNTYDPKEATKLLLAAGLEKTKFTLQTANNSAYTATYPSADLMQSMLAAVGIAQEFKIVEYGTHLTRHLAEGGVYQSFVSRPDVQSYAWAQVGMGGGRIVAGKDIWGPLARNDRDYAAFRAVAEKQRTTLDRDARRELVAEMQRRMASSLWTFTWPAADTPVVASRAVHQFRPRPGWNSGVLRHVWKEA